MSVLAGCFTFQMLKIYKYTPLFTVEANSSTIVEDSNTLKLFSANVLQKNKDYQIVLNQISEKNPDVVLLMETDQSWKNAIHTHLADKYPYQLLKPLDNTYGMLFYSQLPISNKKIRFLVDEEIPSMEAVITLPGGAQFQLYAIHPTPPMPQHSPMSSDRDTEMMQTAFTITDREIPVIVVGDFNDVPWSRTTSLFRKVSRLLDPRIGRGFINTFNAKNIDTSSGVAGAFNTGMCLCPSRDATASRIAENTEIASIRGGSPTAFEWKTVAASFELLLSNCTLDSRGMSPMAGIL